ncbi:MAG: hypothetical protein V4489_03295 [Chlamydiota bacterium]
MSTISGARECGCQEIAAFYQASLKDPKSGVLATESVGPLNGLFVQYIVPTSNGSIKVTCDNGLNTLGFNNLSIVASGFVKVSEAGTSSGGRSFAATSIAPIGVDGSCKITTLFTSAKIVLPSTYR